MRIQVRCFAAVRELFGMAYQDPAARLAQRSRVTPEEVRQAFRAALSTAQLVVPCGVAPDLPGLTEGGCRRDRQEPTGRPGRGSAVRARRRAVRHVHPPAVVGRAGRRPPRRPVRSAAGAAFTLHGW